MLFDRTKHRSRQSWYREVLFGPGSLETNIIEVILNVDLQTLTLNAFVNKRDGHTGEFKKLILANCKLKLQWIADTLKRPKEREWLNGYQPYENV